MSAKQIDSMSESRKNIVVVDDDPQMRSALKEAVTRLGHGAVVFEEPSEALKKLDGIDISMIITDMKMPEMDGVEFIRSVRKQSVHCPVLVITGFATVENAVQAMKEGASDYLMKPFSYDSLSDAISKVMSSSSSNDGEVITRNDCMNNLIHLAGNVAMSDMTVLLLGESGTGKELLARYIHKTSRRSKKPFIAVNCAAIPDNLLESELFGYEKGAFTGATEKKPGKFELAKGGTILLDEIGEMSATLQAKLLRVLQEREIDRVGGRQPVPVDVRVIATTNRDLEKEIAQGNFREDLYYRLSAFPLNLPPLRERPEDIGVLAEHFGNKYARQLNKKIEGFSDETLEYLKKRTWKGNIREFQNAVQRAILMAKSDMLTPEDFMFDELGAKAEPIQTGSLRDMEMDLIMKTLKDTKGNKALAAKQLGISVRTIRNKLNSYGNTVPTA